MFSFVIRIDLPIRSAFRSPRVIRFLIVFLLSFSFSAVSEIVKSWFDDSFISFLMVKPAHRRNAYRSGMPTSYNGGLTSNGIFLYVVALYILVLPNDNA